MKKIKDFNFRYVGAWPEIDELCTLVEQIDSAQWDKFTFRQKNIVGHKFTKTVPLIFDWQKRTRQIYHSQYEAFKPHLDSISNYLQSIGEESNIQRANIVMLMAGQEIKRHTDQGDFLSSTRRLHLPIVTNKDCTFIVDEEEFSIPYGELWEINNTGKPHSVHNRGTRDRIHLIIDVI